MKKTKPKAESGYYCDVCEQKICKYSKDYKSCGGHQVMVGENYEGYKDIDVCHQCVIDISQEGVDSL